MNKSAKIKVTGKVQGVWFRASTKEKAQSLNLYGIVKNLDDGSVQLEVEGEAQAFGELVKWLHIGPMMAKVKNVEVVEQAHKGFTAFEIIRN